MWPKRWLPLARTRSRVPWHASRPDVRAETEIVEPADRNCYFGSRGATFPPGILDTVMRLPEINQGYLEYLNIVVLGESFRNSNLSLAESTGNGD